MPDRINFDLYPPVFPKSEINEEDQRKGELRRKSNEKPVPEEKDKITLKGKTSNKTKNEHEKEENEEQEEKDEKQGKEKPGQDDEEERRPRKIIDIRV